MEWSSSHVSRSGSLSHTMLTVPYRKSTTNTLNISLDVFSAQEGVGIELNFGLDNGWIGETGPLGGAEGEDRGQMGTTRMEEQKLTVELAGVKIKNMDAIVKRRKRRGEREGRWGKGIMRGRGNRNLGTRIRRKENTVRRKLTEKWAWWMHSCLHGFLPSFPDIHTDFNKADLSDKTVHNSRTFENWVITICPLQGIFIYTVCLHLA